MKLRRFLPPFLFPLCLLWSLSGCGDSSDLNLNPFEGTAAALTFSATATASSVETVGFEAAKAIDNSNTTRWSSAFSDPQWLVIDMQVQKSVSAVTILWEAAFGRNYQIQLSNDNVNWTTIRTVTNGDGGTDALTGLSGTGRFLRMLGTARGTQFGYSIFELQITATNPPVDAGAGGSGGAGSGGAGGAGGTAGSGGSSLLNLSTAVATASSVETAGFEAPKAIDGSMTTRWSSLFSDPQWIVIDLGSTKNITRVTLFWESAFGKNYLLQTSPDNSTWTTILTVTNGNGATDDLTGLSGTGQFLRIFGTARGTQWGYSLFEIQIYGSSPPPPVDAGVDAPSGSGGAGGAGSGGSGSGGAVDAAPDVAPEVGSGGSGGSIDAGAGGAGGAGGIPGIGGIGGTDWSVKLIDSTMSRFPTDSSIGSWQYFTTFYMHQQYKVWQRTGTMSYINRIRTWADAHVSATGVIDTALDTLDSMQGMNMLLDLYAETRNTKYQLAALSIRNRLNTYPRTTHDGSPGAFIHQVPLTGQLWADGFFMLNPGLARYGHTLNDAAYTDTETVRQLTDYSTHLKDPVTGLLFHGYDETGTSSWATSTGFHSPFFWCRAVGWFGVAMVDVLDNLDPSNPSRPAIIANIQSLATGLANTQDVASGRWWEVMNMGTTSGNFTETSCSSMHTYVLSKSIEKSYISPSFASSVTAGHNGVLGRISLNTSGQTNLTTIVTATGPGNTFSYYATRPVATDDFHGLGAFLLMREQVARPAPRSAKIWVEAEPASPTAPMTKVADPLASGGFYLTVAAGNNSTAGVPSTGHVSYTFSAPEAGAYRVWGRVIMPTTDDDSFWTRMDGAATWMSWNNNTPFTTAWTWVVIHDSLNGETNQLWPLTAGSHTFELAYREDGAKLDKLLITDDLNFVPTGLGGP